MLSSFCAPFALSSPLKSTEKAVIGRGSAPKQETSEKPSASGGMNTAAVNARLLTYSEDGENKRSSEDKKAGFKPQSKLVELGIKVSFKISYAELTLSSTELGKGTFGQVFKGKYHGIDVAIKKPSLFSTRYIIEDFNNEAVILEKLQHKGLPAVVEYAGSTKDAWGNTDCLVMEYIEGRSVGDFLDKCNSKIEWSTRYRILENTAAAYTDLHQAHFVHADPKWKNVKLLRGLDVKLIDFGAALELSPGQVSKTRSYRGTVGFMAPESIVSRIWDYGDGIYGYASDVFGFGSMIFDMANGYEPFIKFTDDEVQDATVKGKREPIPDDCPKGLARLINRCWEQEPTKRPTMQVVRDELHTLSTAYNKTGRHP